MVQAELGGATDTGRTGHTSKDSDNRHEKLRLKNHSSRRPCGDSFQVVKTSQEQAKNSVQCLTQGSTNRWNGAMWEEPMF
jgi:hypothetical protein